MLGRDQRLDSRPGRRRRSVRSPCARSSCSTTAMTRAPAVVERFGHVEAITIAERCVGAARRVGCARILDSAGRLDALWLANTDADSRVPRDWLRVMVERANNGAHVVLGTVRPSTGITVSHALSLAGATRPHRGTPARPRHQLRDPRGHISRPGRLADRDQRRGSRARRPGRGPTRNANLAHGADPGDHERPPRRARSVRILQLPQRSDRSRRETGSRRGAVRSRRAPG